MARDDLFRRSFEAGTAFLDMTREKAEALVKELVKAGEVKKGKASKLIDEVLERSRRGTEELVQLVRREIGEQVSALGLATKDDLADLESRLAGGGPAGSPGTTGSPGGGPAGTAGTTGTTAPASTTAPAGTTETAPAREVPPVVDPVPGTAAPAAPAGEAQVTGAREVGAKKAAKARAPRKKAAGPATPPAPEPGG